MTDLWPFRPMMGISERLECFSEVLKSRTGEQRISLRQAPRQVFGYTNFLNDHKFSLAKSFALRNSDLEFYVPVWLEQVRAGSLGSADTVIPLDTTMGDWREGGFLVVWQAFDNYVVREISLVEANQITVTAALGEDFHNALVIPVRTCIAKGGFSFRRKSRYAQVSLQFHVQDNINLIGISETSFDLYPEYEDLVVMTDSPLEIAEVAENIVTPAEYFDNGFGPVVIETASDYPDFGQVVTFSDRVGEELWNRRRFLHWLRGKQVPFWLPTFNMDLELQSSVSAVATIITVLSIAPAAFYVGKHIMIELRNGNRYFREITNADTSGANNLLEIAAIGEAFDPEDVLFLCFLSKVRSNTDAFEMVQISPDRIGITIQVIEVPE